MKYTLTKTEFEGLGEDLQKEYTLDGDTATLKIEGEGAPTADRITELEKKREIEIEHRKNAEAKVKEADDRASKLQKDLESASGKEDLEKLRQQHQLELDKVKQERADEAAKFKADRDKSLITAEAQKIAQKFTLPDLIADKIASGLVVQEIGDHVEVRVKDENGQITATTLQEYEKTFLDNSEYKSILKAEAGSGGGASQSAGGGAPSGKKWSELTGSEQVQLRKSSPESAKTLMEAEGLPSG